MQLVRFRHVSLSTVIDPAFRTSTILTSAHRVIPKCTASALLVSCLAVPINRQRLASYHTRASRQPGASFFKPNLRNTKRKTRPIFHSPNERDEAEQFSAEQPSTPAASSTPTTSESSVSWEPPKNQRKNPNSRLSRKVEELENELMWIAHNDPHPTPIQNILDILIREHHRRPKAEYYEALILGHCSDQHGSINAVREILEEMETFHIEFTATALLGVLKVLAVHPDSTLRQYIFDKMARSWIALPIEARHWTIASLIRSNQLELALDELNHLQARHESNNSDGSAVGNSDAGDLAPPWLYTLLLHALTEQHDFTAVLQLLYKLTDLRIPLSPWTHLHVLIIAAANNHYDITAWLWRRAVESMEVDPPPSLCDAVLRLAAHHGKIWLAESALAILEMKQNDSPSNSSSTSTFSSFSSSLSPLSPKEREKLLAQARSHSKKPIEDEPKQYRRGNLWPVFRDENGRGLAHARFDASEVVRKSEERRRALLLQPLRQGRRAF